MQNRERKIKLIVILISVAIGIGLYLYARHLIVSSPGVILSDLEEQHDQESGVDPESSVVSTDVTLADTEELQLNLYGYSVSIPKYTGTPYVELNENKPFFRSEEIVSAYYESYSGLDDLGRVQVAIACLSKETMPTEDEKRQPIGSVRPAGWQVANYSGIISGNYLYNRCHLIGWQLSAENANPFNLTTGTRYLNVDGMLPFENRVDDYIDRTEHHVMYRVTPVFIGDELVCRGLIIEAQSVEDKDCVFNVYCYNVQPGIEIDYLTGDSKLATEEVAGADGTVTIPDNEVEKEYVINVRTKKVHRPTCGSVADIENNNIRGYKGKLSDLLKEGYTTCGKCKPD